MPVETQAIAASAPGSVAPRCQIRQKPSVSWNLLITGYEARQFVLAVESTIILTESFFGHRLSGNEGRCPLVVFVTGHE